MDFLSPSYRRRHGRLLFVSYIFSALIIGALVMFFTLEVSGFYINRSGELSLNSIVFIDSHPANAEIYIDGKLERSRTDARLVLPAGQHFVEIQLPGYDLWQKQVYLDGGEVTHIKYPFLYPINPRNRVVDRYSPTATASQTPDRRWLMVQPRPAQLVFELIDLDHAELVRRNVSFELPEVDVERDLLGVEVLSWAHDNRHFLAELNFDDDDIEYWVFSTISDRLPLQVLVQDDLAVREMRLVDNRVKEVHILYENNQLFAQSLTDDELPPRLVADDVLEFVSYGDDLVVYVRATLVESLVEVVIKDDQTEYLFLELTAQLPDSQYLLGLSRFEGDWYYVVGPEAGDTELLILKNPLEAIKQDRQPIPLTKVALSGLGSVAFSNNVRFVGATYSGGLYIYDFEDQRSYRYTVAGLASDYDVSWMDGHRLYGVVDNNLSVWEFDSSHQVSLGAVRATEDAFFDKSYDTLYVLHSGHDDDDSADLELSAIDLIIKR